MKEIVKRNDYLESQKLLDFNLERCWEMTLWNKEKVYLTDEEKDNYLKLISQGMKFVSIKSCIIPNTFSSILPIKGLRGIKLEDNSSFEPIKRTANQRNEISDVIKKMKKKLLK